MGKKALVIGGGVEGGIQAALDLADAQVEVTLVEEAPSLRTDKSARALLFMPKLLKAISHPNINIIASANVTQVKGERGNFRATVIKHPRYVDVDICTSCGRCERACPVDIIQANARNGHKAIHYPDFGLKSVPSACIIDKKGIPSCTAACPAGVNSYGYVALISKGKFAEALDLITEVVPFPRVLGRVCSHPCESKCTRAKIDRAVAICALKRFAADSNSAESSLIRTHSNNAVKPDGAPEVAIIGAGPAGLTAARDLARLGHKPTVFEALPVPGGMITVGMPRFRLPREIRQADVNDIVRLGIEIRTSTPIGKDLTLEDLKRQGYKAILIATGAHKNQRLGIAGENLSGVIDSIALLQALNLKQPITVGKKVVVIGGGYTAIDSARTAIRLYCERVIILYRRSLEEMPANPEEVAEAQEEGVEIQFLVAPVRIIGEEGKVVGVECIRMGLGEPDASGRRRPIPIEGSEFCIEADTVIVAVGQRPDLSFLGEDTTLTDARKHVVIDRHTMATKVPGIFAAGDVAGEPGTLIEAIAAGRRAAISIGRFLRGEELKEERPKAKAAPVEVELDKIFIPLVERQKMPCLPLKDRVCNFEEVDLGFTAEMAVREAKRCLNCAGCSLCLECERACELKAIDHNSTTHQFELEVDAIVATGSPTKQATADGVYFISPSPDGDLSQASAIAAKVMVDLSKHRPSREKREVKQEVRRIEPVCSQQRTGNPEFRAGVFVCGCGGNISEVVDVPDVVDYCKGISGVTYAGEIDYACTDESAEEIKSIARQHNLTHAVLASCSCCNLDQICFSCSDRRICCKSNLLYYGNTISYEFVNIREHCAWAHHSQPAVATDKASSLIKAAVARARESKLSEKRMLNVERSALVVGEGLGGMQAAADLAAQGFKTILVSYDKRKRVPPFEQSDSPRQNLVSELVRNGATMLYGVKLISLDGTAGRYQATLAQNGKSLTFTVGTIILDSSAIEDELPPMLLKALRGKNSQKTMEPVLSRLPGIFLCGDGADTAQALIQGSAAAAKASILLNKGTIDTEQTIATVDQQRCRGCGTCVSVCPFAAVSLCERSPGIFTAQIDEGLCLGCGICVARCPSGALSQNGYSDSQITASLEAILS